MWDLGFTYDSVELSFENAVYGLGMDEYLTDDDTIGNLRLVAWLQLEEPDMQMLPNQVYDIASM
jgi:hypothetical protein